MSAEIATFNASIEANDTKDDTKQLTDRQQIILDLIRKDDTKDTSIRDHPQTRIVYPQKNGSFRTNRRTKRG